MKATRVIHTILLFISTIQIGCSDPFGQLNPRKSDGVPPNDGLRFANAAYIEFDEEYGFGSTRLPRGPNGERIDPATLPFGGCEWLDPDRAPRSLDMCKAINTARRQDGLPVLVLNLGLMRAAWKHARHMSDGNYFSHDDPDGATPTDRIKQEGVNTSGVAENIAKGTAKASDTLSNWLNSTENRGNILSGALKYHGIAYFKAHWVEDFAE